MFYEGYYRNFSLIFRVKLQMAHHNNPIRVSMEKIDKNENFNFLHSISYRIIGKLFWPPLNIWIIFSHPLKQQLNIFRTPSTLDHPPNEILFKSNP